MSIQLEDLNDLTTVTLKHLGRGKWEDLSLDEQEFYALPNLMKKDRITFDSGTSLQINLQVEHGGASRNLGPFDPRNYNIPETQKTGDVPWRHTTVPWAIGDHEIITNMNAAKILDIMKVRESQAYCSLAERMEINFWGKPTDSTDNVTPFGIQYWIVPNATAGFNGGNPAGFTAGAAGVSSVTYPRWRNYTDRYVDFSKADAVQKMRTAFRKIQFKAPFPNQHQTHAKGSDRYKIFTNENAFSKMETVAEEQNENLGKDFARYFNNVVFAGVPCCWVPYLDNRTDDPIYFMNFAVFQCAFLKGEYMNRIGPRRLDHQPRMQVMDLDCTYNWRCVNRRKTAILNTAG